MNSTLKTFFIQNKLWVLFGIILFFQLCMLAILSVLNNPKDALSLQLTFSLDQFLSIIGGWSSKETHAYLLHYTLDFLYPLWYVLLLWELMKKWDHTSTQFYFNALWIIPFMAGLCDEIENLSTLTVIFFSSYHAATFVFIQALAAWTKWIAIFLSMVLLIFLKMICKKQN